MEDPEYPTVCEHDKLHIVGIEPEKISKEDKKELESLGFIIQIKGVTISYVIGEGGSGECKY